MTSLLVSTLLVLAAGGPAAPAADLAPEVKALVVRLEARELGVRDAAERKLLELGTDVLPLLPAINERTPAEVAIRVTRVQQKLLRVQALAAMKPALVTLQRAEMPLSEALQELTRQTGNPIVDHREAFGEQRTESTIKADFVDTPFWRALDSVLDQADLTLYGFAGQRGAYVVGRPPGAAPRAAKACYAGVFRLEPLRFEAVRDLRNDASRSLKFFMEVTWEPRLQPFALLLPLRQVRATLDTGEILSVANADAEPEAISFAGVSSVELPFSFTLPDCNAKSIATLKGSISALVPGPFEDFRFLGLRPAARNAPSRRVELRKAGTTVTLDHVRKNNAAWEVALRLKFEAPAAALESHRSWVLDNEAFFERPDKSRIAPGGMEQTLQNKDEIGINYYFSLTEDPQKLTFVYRTPIMVLELPVAYEFRDLRLP